MYMAERFFERSINGERSLPKDEVGSRNMIEEWPPLLLDGIFKDCNGLVGSDFDLKDTIKIIAAHVAIESKYLRLRSGLHYYGTKIVSVGEESERVIKSAVITHQ
jgi:hypothetical protein